MSEIVKLPGSELERAAANIIEHAGKNVLDGAGSFGSLVLNGIFGDRIREWRTQNLVKGAAQTAKILKEQGVSLEKARALPMLEFYSIFEGMSEQDDDDVAKLWAGLLASRMSNGDAYPFDRGIISTLKMISGIEARALLFAYQLNDLRMNYLRREEAEGSRFDVHFVENRRQLEAEFQKEVIGLRERTIGDTDALSSAPALDGLVDKGLLTAAIPRLSTFQLTETQSTGDSWIETLAEHKLTDAFNDIFSTIESGQEISDQYRELFWAPPDYVGKPSLQLSSFGYRLLRRCSGL